MLFNQILNFQTFSFSFQVSWKNRMDILNIYERNTGVFDTIEVETENKMKW